MIPPNLTGLDYYFGRNDHFRNRTFAVAAQQKFDSSRARGQLSRAWRYLIRRPALLLDLSRLKKDADIRICRYERGFSTVAIAEIRGSENRSRDFDINFNPIHSGVKARWIRIAVSMSQGKVPAPVELIQLNNTYFVSRGHCRISVARALKQEEIEARLTVMEIEPTGARSLSMVCDRPCLAV